MNGKCGKLLSFVSRSCCYAPCIVLFIESMPIRIQGRVYTRTLRFQYSSMKYDVGLIAGAHVGSVRGGVGVHAKRAHRPYANIYNLKSFITICLEVKQFSDIFIRFAAHRFISLFMISVLI